MKTIKAGFIPLIDCASLVVAREKGFAAARGLDLVLSREPSWATLRDKVAYGMLDCAQMLAGMVLALHLGAGGEPTEMAVPMALGQGGNAITLASWLVGAMGKVDAEAMAGPRVWRNRVLARVIRLRQRQGEGPLRLATVFPYSSHHYELRYWLAAAGIDCEREVELVVIPPPRMVAALETGEIAGFCVGEPWNQLAVARGVGEVVVTKHDLWPCSPEKVLGLRAAWLAENGVLVEALVTALIEAGRWADQPEHRAELTALLAREAYIGVEAALIEAVLAQRPRLNAREGLDLPGYQRFHGHLAQYPWVSQGEWLISQMMRWGQIGEEPASLQAVARIYRPDLYRRAALALGLPVPATSRKVEGGHREAFALPLESGGEMVLPADALFDGHAFDSVAFGELLRV
ncbi:MAG: ABC transporter substrate-binding protein [Magnetococcales bacterium]|nr:ABC transporter substrate-binding protein [Magnetococcales bacterium]